MQTVSDPKGVLLLDDGTVFWGNLVGNTTSKATGELCFQTAMTGYQEIITDPSYLGQIIVFTFPHIGNVGHNNDDWEATTIHASAVIVREKPTAPSNYRSKGDIISWLKLLNKPLLYGIDTRGLTTHIRSLPRAPLGIIAPCETQAELTELDKKLRSFNGLIGADLASEASTKDAYHWQAGLWGHAPNTNLSRHIVVMDFGTKEAILRHLNQRGCRVTVVPANASIDEIMGYEPDGVLLSNGPGDPSATLSAINNTIRALLQRDIPIFGICLGYQMLAILMGAQAQKMVVGHHGANHPVQDLQSKKVIITSQNHGFMIDKNTLPPAMTATHISLFDGTLQGFSVHGKKISGVQFHPECSPGPSDGNQLFDEWLQQI